MKELPEQVKNNLRTLISQPQWKSFLFAKEAWQKSLREDPLIQSTPTETMTNAYKLDGMTQGIDELLRQIMENL